MSFLTMKVAFLDRSTLPDGTQLHRISTEHEFKIYAQTSPEQLEERIKDVDILIVNKVRLSHQSLRTAKRLKHIAVAATGTDNLDLSACRELGISVSNIRNYAVRTVPEHTFALIFALRRNICAYRDAVHNQRWQASGQFCFFDYSIRDLAGSTLGIIGDGVLGQAVGQLGKALGMRVIFSGFKGRSDQGVLYTPFDKTLAESDIISLHCPLTEQTRNMIGPAEFAMMKRAPLLINTARGELVDEFAVDPALEAGQISGAGFDTVSVEPPPLDHPFMGLLNRSDFILTPHVAWASEEAIQMLADQLIDNVEAFLRGEVANIVG